MKESRSRRGKGRARDHSNIDLLAENETSGKNEKVMGDDSGLNEWKINIEELRRKLRTKKVTKFMKSTKHAPPSSKKVLMDYGLLPCTICGFDASDKEILVEKH